MAIRIQYVLLVMPAILGLLPTLAHADDLHSALQAAYDNNPTLTGARAAQRAIDEDVTIARAAALPSLSGTVNYTENVRQSALFNPSPRRVFDGQVGATLPLYSGGSIRNRLRAAKSRDLAGRSDLAATDEQILGQVVTVYMDVIRDSAILALRQSDVAALEVTLKATEARFRGGDLTRTDVAQASTRLAGARAGRETAAATLLASRERYLQLVGHSPGELAEPPALPGLPGSVVIALQAALDANPDLLAARERTTTARFDVETAAAARLPRINLTTGLNRTDYLNSFSVANVPQNVISERGTAVTVGVQLSMPIFQAGLPAAQRRQALDRLGQALERAVEVERSVVATTRSAWAQWRGAEQAVSLDSEAVAGARQALVGVRAENRVGHRTILDVLNAEQELLNAEVQLVTAHHDAYVAAFNLLAAAGLGSASALGLDRPYDPVINYDRVRHKILDWDREPTPTRVATSTAASEPETGIVPATTLPK